mmetsp:Transcript_21194/g.50265  ORF Transcript_21194/g.50265 Transcript_21194/m.50265 type:complete len:233 (-) Transcript_21194:139-837(-)
MNMRPQLPRRLELVSVRLSLERRRCRQPHVFGVVVDCVFPKRQPRRVWFMRDPRPVVSRHWADRRQSVFGAVHDDVLRHDTPLERPHLGVLSTSSEETRRFDAEVAQLLFVCVDNRKHMFRLLNLLVCLDLKLLLFCGVLLDLALLHEPRLDGGEIHVFQFLDNVRSTQQLPPVSPEVVVKALLLHVVCLQHGRVHSRDLFLSRGQLHILPLVLELHTMRSVVRWENAAMVF